MTTQTLERKLKPYEEPAKCDLFKWLLVHLPPQPITGKGMHRDYAKAVEILLTEAESGTLSEEDGESVVKYIDAIAPFIEAYEKREYPIGPSTPEEILRFLMDQNGLKQEDLAAELGGQSVVSLILNGKRALTREQIEKLSKRFKVSPSAFFPSARP